MLPTGSAKTALLPAILGDVTSAGGGGAPIERENEGGMDHFMDIEKREKKRQRKRKIRTTEVESKVQRKMIEAADLAARIIAQDRTGSEKRKMTISKSRNAVRENTHCDI